MATSALGVRLKSVIARKSENESRSSLVLTPMAFMRASERMCGCRMPRIVIFAYH